MKDPFKTTEDVEYDSKNAVRVPERSSSSQASTREN